MPIPQTRISEVLKELEQLLDFSFDYIRYENPAYEATENDMLIAEDFAKQAGKLAAAIEERFPGYEEDEEDGDDEQ